MFKAINLAIAGLLIFAGRAESENLKRASDYLTIETRLVRTIALPRWYHEGLFVKGNEIWVSNGKGGVIWVVDTSTGSVISQIEPVAGFLEAVVQDSDGNYFATDWQEKKLYKARIESGRMVPVVELDLAPSHPAGLAFVDSRLYVITWRRGLGTKFSIVEVNKEMEVVRDIRIEDIQEPAHMAWDGSHLWITSWFYKYVYKVDMSRMKIVGQFASPVEKTTGIAWDGRYLWVTGTYGDLYQMEILRPGQTKEADPMKITVTSSAFKEGGMIPKRYTCDGEELSPPLAWSGIPQGTRSIALISDDPDAPRGDWVHWLIFNLPPDTEGLPEGVSRDEVLPGGAAQGKHDGGGVGYGGPCPPSGTHRYYFKVYSLDTKLTLGPDATKKSLLEAMDGHILAEGRLMGRYKRSK